MSKCSKTTNNKYFNCPPRMDDARHFTDYRPNCHSTNVITGNANIQNSYELRKYLQQNAVHIMDTNRQLAYERNNCGPCEQPYNKGTMLPEYEIQKCNQHTCETYINDPNGIGLGRYSASNGDCGFKNKTLSSCCATDEDLKNYYTLDNQPPLKRVTIPGGGIAMSGGDLSVYE